jgi:hypothetical protein
MPAPEIVIFIAWSAPSDSLSRPRYASLQSDARSQRSGDDRCRLLFKAFAAA